VRKEDRGKIRVARREFKLQRLKERIETKKKRVDFLMSRLLNNKEKLVKVKEVQDRAIALVKHVQTGKAVKAAVSDERQEKKTMLKNSEKRDNVLQARAALSADNMRREEISSAFTMKVKILKMRSRQYEKRALDDQGEANERAAKARDAEDAVLRLEKRSKRIREKALAKIADSNRQTVDKDKQHVKEAATDAKVAGEEARKDMKRSARKNKKFESDQKKARSIDKKVARAKKRVKVAEKNMDEAAVRRTAANKKYAKAKFAHAYSGVLFNNIPDEYKPGTPPPPPNPKLSHPGPELKARVAAQEKTVADLEFQKAKQEEQAARMQVVVLSREAQLAKKEDGKAAVSAQRDARDAVKTAAKDQERANDVFKEENAKMQKADKKSSQAVANIMTSKTGLSRAKQAAKDAQDAAALAAKKALRSVAEARRVSLKLREAIDRSAEAVSDMDRQVAKSMEVVLPAEKRKTASVWEQAKAANDKLKRFRDMVSQGRDHLVEYGQTVRKSRAKHKKKFDDAVDAADTKLESALASITSSEQQIQPDGVSA